MKYNIEIEVVNGLPTIKGYSHDPTFGSFVPDGFISIGGTEDEDNRAINVQRTRPDGVRVIEAQHFQNMPAYQEVSFDNPERIKASLIRSGFTEEEASIFAQRAVRPDAVQPSGLALSFPPEGTRLITGKDLADQAAPPLEESVDHNMPLVGKLPRPWDDIPEPDGTMPEDQGDN